MTTRTGRKRDPSRDGVILDSTLAVLAEYGFDKMTIDLVAARAGMARATIYRRWATKAELVLDAVARLSRSDVDIDNLPDTGNLRDDMVAMIRPFDDDEQQLHIQAVVGLLVLAHTEPHLAAAATGSGIGPWIEVNRILIQRAVDRGEYPQPAEIDTLAEVIPMLCVSRAAQRLPIDSDFSVAMIDGIVLPALRGGGGPVAKEERHVRQRRHASQLRR